ncbi:MAG: MCP four helix bundle domain-containing protein [Desulfuromonadales bacterium]
MKVGTKLFSVIALMALVVIAVGSIGFYAARVSHEGLVTVYKDRVEPLEQLKTVSDMYAVNIVDTTHKARDGAVSWADARRNVAEAQKTVTRKWQDYLATYLDPEEKKLVDQAIPLLKKADEAVASLNAILDREDREELRRFAATELYPAIDPLTRKIDALVEIQLVVAKKEYQKSETSYHNGKLYSAVLIVAGLLLSGLLATFIIRRLLADLGGEPSYVREIARTVADGDLSIIVATDDDKHGSVMWAMKVMVDKLRVLISEKDAKNQQLEHMAKELDAKVVKLETALEQVKQLEGIISICTYCHKIRDDQNSWQQLERYISAHTDAQFSHGMCPDCLKIEMEKLDAMGPVS